MNTDNNPCINPIEEQRKEALRHYEEVSSAALHWSGFVEAAIKAYNPEQSKVQAPERIEVKNLWVDEVMFGSNPVKPKYHFDLIKNSFIPSHKFPAIKQAIENCINGKEDELRYISFDKLELTQHEKIERAAAYVERYRNDYSMTSHRIAHSLLYPTTTMNAYREPLPENKPKEQGTDTKVE